MSKIREYTFWELWFIASCVLSVASLLAAFKHLLFEGTLVNAYPALITSLNFAGAGFVAAFVQAKSNG